MLKEGNRSIQKAPQSTFLTRVTFTMILFSCALLLLSTARQVPAQELTEKDEWIYIVAPDDNLWDISRTYLKELGKWGELQRLNQIPYPRKIPPGTPLRIPVSWLKVQPAVVRVQHLQGTVYVTRADGSRQSLTIKTTLYIGDTVRSEAASMTTLRLADGSLVLLQEKSQLTFDTLSVYEKTGMVDTRMRLLDGRVESDVKSIQPPAGRFEIWTPAALSAVRGTRFRAIMDDATSTYRAEVSHGNIRVSASDQEVTVAEGFGTAVNVGEPPTPPRALLAPPDVTGLASLITAHSPHFTLIALSGAEAYRVQIMHAGQPNAPLFDHRFSDLNIKGPTLGDGDYLLRVRGIDEAGFEGLDADHRFTVDIPPPAPLPTTPEPGAALNSSQIHFKWQPAPDVAHYRFQLATDESFSNLTMDITGIVALELQPEHPLQSGDYYWRIASVNTKGNVSAFSTPQSLKVLHALSAPQILAVSEAYNRVSVSWDTTDAASRYELQVAFDPDFEDLWQVVNAQNSATKFPQPPVASYYLRVRAMDAAAQPGPYGDVYHVPAKPSSAWLFSALLLIGLSL